MIDVKYKIRSSLNAGIYIFDNLVFDSKTDAELAIRFLAEQEYGTDFHLYAKNSKGIQLIHGYWAGDYSWEECEDMLKRLHIRNPKYSFDSYMQSALYWDFIGLFNITKVAMVHSEKMEDLLKTIEKHKRKNK